MYVVEHVIAMAAIYLVGALFLWPQVHYARQLSLVQGALFGVGGYVAAILVTRYSATWMIALFAGGVAGLLLNVAFSTILSSARGDGFALATIGLQMAVVNLFVAAESITGGPAGIFFIPPIFTGHMQGILFPVLIGALASVVLYYLPAMRAGMYCRAVGDDSLLYDSMGKSSRVVKHLLSACAGFGAAFAGGLLVAHLRVAEPSLFTGTLSISLLAMVYLMPGKPIIALTVGCAVFTALPELLRFTYLPSEYASQIRYFIYSALLILAAFRQGSEPEALPGALRSRESQ